MGDWEQRELYRMFIMNDEPLYKQQEYMNQNLARKKYKGVYNPALAPKLFHYLIDGAIKKYNEQFPDAKISLTKEDKATVANEMIEDFEERFKNKEFEPYKQKYLLKKKGCWRFEGARHALARKGIKTGRKINEKRRTFRRGQEPYHEIYRGMHFVGFKIGDKKYPQAVYSDETWKEENMKFKKLVRTLDL